MINVPVSEIRQHFEGLLGRSLAHVPLVEWQTFLGVNGPFQASDWERSHQALTNCGGRQMPHYKNGEEAKVGDRVRGTGYNAKRCGYDPEKGVEGIVTEIRVGENKAGSCTLSVAFLRTTDEYQRGMLYVAGDQRLTIDVEYGDTVGFEKVS